VSGKQPTYLTFAQFVKYEGCFQHRKQKKKYKGKKVKQFHYRLDSS